VRGLAVVASRNFTADDTTPCRYGDAKGHVALAEVQALRSKLTHSERLMADMSRSWEEKLRVSEQMRLANAKALEEQGVLTQAAQQMMDNRRPNLVNLNEDPQLSEMLVYNIKVRAGFAYYTAGVFFFFFFFFARIMDMWARQEGRTSLGRGAGNEVQLQGIFVRENHAVIECSPSEVLTLTCIEDAVLYVNGSTPFFKKMCMCFAGFSYKNGVATGVLLEPDAVLELKHSDRVVIGKHHFFRVNIPSAVRNREQVHVENVIEDVIIKVSDLVMAC
jgi:kinesin family protein 14